MINQKFIVNQKLLIKIHNLSKVVNHKSRISKEKIDKGGFILVH